MPSLDSLTPDKFQSAIIGMSAERTAVVKGFAGSGKSFVLLKKAKQVSTLTDSYAIIVYTKSLKQFFVDELSEIDQSGKHVFYHKEWEKVQQVCDTHYKYLFIDECQDFNAAEIDNFRVYGQYCWFFGDSEQTIMTFPDHSTQTVDATAKQLGVHAQNLGPIYRLTIENAKVGEYIKPNGHLSAACFKHGPKPQLIECLNQLDEIIRRYNGGLTDVGILVYYGSQIEKIRNYFQEKGIPVQWKTKDSMNIDFKSKSPKVLTWHCAKGLQFSNVFIPFCGHNDDRTNPVDPYRDKVNALYVAATRPLENLFLLHTNVLSNILPPADSDVYLNNNVVKNPFSNFDFSTDDLPF